MILDILCFFQEARQSEYTAGIVRMQISLACLLEERSRKEKNPNH